MSTGIVSWLRLVGVTAAVAAGIAGFAAPVETPAPAQVVVVEAPAAVAVASSSVAD